MHPRFSKATLGGLLGTAAMTAMMYLVAPMLGLRMDIAAMLGSMLGGSWAAGMAMHVVLGTLVFPGIYVFALYDSLLGPAVVKGAIWGVGLWLAAQVMVMPLIGGGLFSSAMGGGTTAAGSLVGHLLYGTLLGVVAYAQEARTAQACASSRCDDPVSPGARGALDGCPDLPIEGDRAFA